MEAQILEEQYIGKNAQTVRAEIKSKWENVIFVPIGQAVVKEDFDVSRLTVYTNPDGTIARMMRG